MRNASPCCKTFEVLCTILDLCDLLKQHLLEADFTEPLSMASQSLHKLRWSTTFRNTICPQHHFYDLLSVVVHQGMHIFLFWYLYIISIHEIYYKFLFMKRLIIWPVCFIHWNWKPVRLKSFLSFQTVVSSTNNLCLYEQIREIIKFKIVYKYILI